MKLSSEEWRMLSRLLDDALDLQVPRRAQWLDALPSEHRALLDPLRDLLLEDGAPSFEDVARYEERPR